MWHAVWNEIFLSGLYRNPLPIDDQGITALHHEHIFVVSVDMLCGCCSFTAGPKRHLASVSAVENITFNAWGSLIGRCDLVRGLFHELGKIVHSCKILSHSDWIGQEWNLIKRRRGTAALPSLFLLIPN
jgi:hypothetical protein